MILQRTDNARTAGRRPSERPVSDDTVLQLRAAQAARTEEELTARLVDWLTRRRGIAAAAAVRQDGEGSFAIGPHSFDGPAFERADWREALEAVAAAAVAASSTASGKLDGVRNASLIGVSATGGRPGDAAFAAAVVDGPDRPAAEQSLITAAAVAEKWHADAAGSEAGRRVALAAATIDLVADALAGGDRRAAAVRVANRLREHLNCRAVVVGLRKGTRCRTAAVSGMAAPDGRSSGVRRFDAVLDESTRRGRPAVSPAEPGNRDGLLEHERLRRDESLEHVVTQPLLGPDGEAAGAVLALFDRGEDAAAAAKLLAVAAEPLAGAVTALGSRRRTNGSRWRWPMLILAAAVVGSMWLPVPYAVTCACRTEPSIRRFVVAPFEGLLESTLAVPGDVVGQGDVLARMDGRDLRSEVAGLTAEAARAAKDADTRLVAGDAAGAQRARLELAAVKARLDVLRRRVESLDVRSPIAGVVIEGDLDRVENAPVSVGDPLYEVAPLDELVVEVELPAEDYPHFSVGDPVRVRLDGSDVVREGTVDAIQPRSEARGGRNVFVVEVRLPNDGGSLRPGMTGFARVLGGDRSLGWTLFHKPWERFRSSIPIGW